VWITDLFSDRAQEQIADDLRDDWVDPEPGPVAPEFGAAFAFLHIPRFGQDYSRAIVEGTEPEELGDAPGHYVGSAMPGEQGNFSLAGHRVGEGSVFLNLDQLDPGDAVVIETVDTWHVYRVTSTEIVAPNAMSVVAPTPGGPLDGPPTGAFLTMTTCHPKFTSRDRLVVHAQLESSLSKVDAPAGPPALSET
jgi:sortase A